MHPPPEKAAQGYAAAILVHLSDFRRRSWDSLVKERRRLAEWARQAELDPRKAARGPKGKERALHPLTASGEPLFSGHAMLAVAEAQALDTRVITSAFGARPRTPVPRLTAIGEPGPSNWQSYQPSPYQIANMQLLASNTQRSVPCDVANVGANNNESDESVEGGKLDGRKSDTHRTSAMEVPSDGKNNFATSIAQHFRSFAWRSEPTPSSVQSVEAPISPRTRMEPQVQVDEVGDRLENRDVRPDEDRVEEPFFLQEA